MEFELTPAQRKVYNQMRDLGFALMEDRACTPSIALTVLLRLQQIACGYLVTDLRPGEEEPWVLPISPNPRLDLLEEVVDGIEHQGIIWARFIPDIDSICAMLKKMGRTFVRYDGSIDEDQCEINENRFHDGSAQWFVANQQKGGEGLTLVEARTMIYFSNSFKLLERLQSEDRAHRYGMTGPLDIIDLVSAGTMEEGLINNLIGKYDVASIITGDGFRDWLKPIGRLL
jgi:SNF2 family DNA or RNA helicase